AAERTLPSGTNVIGSPWTPIVRTFGARGASGALGTLCLTVGAAPLHPRSRRRIRESTGRALPDARRHRPRAVRAAPILASATPRWDAGGTNERSLASWLRPCGRVSALPLVTSYPSHVGGGAPSGPRDDHGCPCALRCPAFAPVRLQTLDTVFGLHQV